MPDLRETIGKLTFKLLTGSTRQLSSGLWSVESGDVDSSSLDLNTNQLKTLEPGAFVPLIREDVRDRPEKSGSADRGEKSDKGEDKSGDCGTPFPKPEPRPEPKEPTCGCTGKRC